MHLFGETAGVGWGTASLWRPVLISVAFALLAHRLRGVSGSGAVAGAVVCFLLYAGAGAGAFVVLVAVFALTWVATRFGYLQKQRLGTAESRDGRAASQVLANLGVAAACAAIYAVTGRNPLLLLACAAALSEAAADTVSSELGQACGDSARLITTWERVASGTDGGISVIGTLSGCVAAGLISLVSVAIGLVPWRWIGISALAAVVGMIADSFLGAGLERRGWLNNDAVNFLSTLVAAGTAYLLA